MRPEPVRVGWQGEGVPPSEELSPRPNIPWSGIVRVDTVEVSVDFVDTNQHPAGSRDGTQW